MEEGRIFRQLPEAQDGADENERGHTEMEWNPERPVIFVCVVSENIIAGKGGQKIKKKEKESKNGINLHHELRRRCNPGGSGIK